MIRKLPLLEITSIWWTIRLYEFLSNLCMFFMVVTRKFQVKTRKNSKYMHTHECYTHWMKWKNVFSTIKALGSMGLKSKRSKLMELSSTKVLYFFYQNIRIFWWLNKWQVELYIGFAFILARKKDNFINS